MERHRSRPACPPCSSADLHYGEVVDPAQVGGVNSYNVEEVARQRMAGMITDAVKRPKRPDVRPEYPGHRGALRVGTSSPGPSTKS